MAGHIGRGILRKEFAAASAGLTRSHAIRDHLTKLNYILDFTGVLMTTYFASPEEALEQKSYSQIARDQDLDRIVNFINRAFADENDYLLTDRTNLEEIRGLMQKGHFLLREEAGTLVGLIYGEIRGQGRGYLGLLAVEPTKRRDGIGKQLLLAGEDFCREHGCRIVEGTVINRRPDLLERYKRRGFRVISETPGDRIDCVEGGYSLILIEKDL